MFLGLCIREHKVPKDGSIYFYVITTAHGGVAAEGF